MQHTSFTHPVLRTTYAGSPPPPPVGHTRQPHPYHHHFNHFHHHPHVPSPNFLPAPLFTSTPSFPVQQQQRQSGNPTQPRGILKHPYSSTSSSSSSSTLVQQRDGRRVSFASGTKPDRSTIPPRDPAIGTSPVKNRVRVQTHYNEQQDQHQLRRVNSERVSTWNEKTSSSRTRRTARQPFIVRSSSKSTARHTRRTGSSTRRYY